MGPEVPGAWFVPIQSYATASLRLFCLPYAGGGVSVFSGWREAGLPQSIDVYAVQLPGRGARLKEKPFINAAEAAESLAAALLPMTGNSYALFGHSLGALLAYETAQELTRVGARAPAVLIVSARRAPQIPLRRAPAWDLGEADFVRELRRLQGTPEEVLASTELMQLLMPQLRSDFQMEETYLHPLDYPLLTCPIVAFGGLHDKEVTEPDLLSWNAVTRAGAKLQRVFNSGHFYIHTHASELVREIESVLTTGGVGPVPTYAPASSREF